MRLDLEGGGSLGSEVGVEGLRQLQVDGAAGGKVQLLFVQQREASLDAQVGFFTGDVKGVKMDEAIGESGVDATLA